MGTITVGGGAGDYLTRVVDGVITVVPYGEIAFYAAEVGGAAYDTVTDPSGDETPWPGGTGKAGPDGAIPTALIDAGANTPSGAWADSPKMKRRVWVRAHEAGGTTDGGNDGEYLELSRYLGLNGKGRIRIGGTNTRLQISTDDGVTWNDVDTGGTSSGSDADALYVLRWDAGSSSWKKMAGGSAITARPAIGTRSILFLSMVAGVSVPSWAAATDVTLIAT